MRPRGVISLIAGLLLAGGPLRGDDLLRHDEETLRAVGLKADGPALLTFFRTRAAGDAGPEKAQDLVRQLGEGPGDARDRAMGILVALGPVSIPWLRQAMHDPDDPAVADRARKCLEAIDGPTARSVSVAAVRVLAARQPAGAAEALLAYMAVAEDDGIVEEIEAALATLARRDGKPNAALLMALEDKSPLLRAVAAEALAQPGDDPPPKVRKLLYDPNPVVRLRVALHLTEHRDAEAVGTLITLLGELPAEQGKRAEEWLLGLAGEEGPDVPLTNDASRPACRDAWAKWWKASEGAASLDELRRRTLTDETQARALALIRQLGDDTFRVREKAQAELKAMGAAVLPLLRHGLHDPDAEVRSRCQETLEALDRAKVQPLAATHVKLIALRKPPGAAEVLLAYLPSAEDEAIASEVHSALAAVVVRNGAPDPTVLKALDDPVGARRAAAAVALCQAVGFDGRPLARRRVQDPDPAVRLPVALALAKAQDRDAVPVLIDLLAEAPHALAEQAESYLRETAGDEAPAVPLGRDGDGGKQCRDAWAGWWKVRGERVSLPRPSQTPRLLGRTLIVMTNNGRVVEIGPDGKERWRLQALMFPFDARVLHGDRVLIAEFQGGRVTERNLKGEILWQRPAQHPVGVQRLANGNTVIATRNQLLEVTRDGKEVFSFQRPQYDIMGGMKGRDGRYVYFTANGQAVILDGGGKELLTLATGMQSIGGADLLPNGRLLVPVLQMNKIVEYDLDGKAVWEAAFPLPSAVARLPNGHTLVSSQNTSKVAELDRAGKIVWEYQCRDGQPWRVRRR